MPAGDPLLNAELAAAAQCTSARELLSLSPSQQRCWAARPELPISGRDA